MYHNIFFVPPKFCISIVFNFSWDLRQVENNAYAKFWRDKKEYYGKFESGLFLQNVDLPNVLVRELNHFVSGPS